MGNKITNFNSHSIPIFRLNAKDFNQYVLKLFSKIVIAKLKVYIVDETFQKETLKLFYISVAPVGILPVIKVHQGMPYKDSSVGEHGRSVKLEIGEDIINFHKISRKL